VTTSMQLIELVMGLRGAWSSDGRGCGDRAL